MANPEEDAKEILIGRIHEGVDAANLEQLRQLAKVLGIQTEIHDRALRQVPADRPKTLVLDESLKACLEQMRQDFDRGIVRVEEEKYSFEFAEELSADKTAGHKWETIEARLLANGADLLKRAAAMPAPEHPDGRACLIGVYENGELAIRQRSQEIVNARWTNDWKGNDLRAEKGDLQLLPHTEALARPAGRWAKAGEIMRAVTVAGYHLPPTPSTFRIYSGPMKIGLVAASEAVTGEHYLAENCGALLECDEKATRNEMMCLVRSYSSAAETFFDNTLPRFRDPDVGAILWLRG